MKKIRDWLLIVDENKIIKRATFWNLISSLLNAFMSAIFLFFIARLNGVEQAGIFSIASAFSYQCLSLGNFGVRNYHASDVKNDYEYSDYYYVRCISSVFMYLLLIYFAFFKGYSIEKAIIILGFGIFKSFDCFEDLIHGEFQRQKRLDIGCILQSARYIISIICFILILLLTKNFIITCIITSIVTGFMLIIFNKPILKKYIKEKINFNKYKIKKLFMICLPICIGNLINMYIINCPKYAIDSFLNDTFQSYYGILSIPVFTINLLSTVIFKPQVNSLGAAWQNKNYKKFFKLILNQILVIFGLTFLMCLFGYIIGLSLIELIYNVKLHKFMYAFILLLIGGGLNSLAVYFSVVLTTARAQNKLFIGYFVTLIFALLVSKPLISNFEINGAAYLYCLLNLVTFLIFSVFIIIKYKKER